MNRPRDLMPLAWIMLALWIVVILVIRHVFS